MPGQAAVAPGSVWAGTHWKCSRAHTLVPQAPPSIPTCWATSTAAGRPRPPAPSGRGPANTARPAPASLTSTVRTLFLQQRDLHGRAAVRPGVGAELGDDETDVAGETAEARVTATSGAGAASAGRQLAVESAVRQHLLGELPSGEKDGPAAAADPDALASSRAGLAVPGGQAAAIIAMRARALACALAQAHARACALRFAVRGVGRPVPVLGRASAIDRALGCDLTRALLQARDVTRDLMRARDLARDFTRASAGGSRAGSSSSAICRHYPLMRCGLRSHGGLVSAPIASAVGRAARSTLRRRASSRTCCITGSRCRPRRTSRGDAAGWWSAPAPTARAAIGPCVSKGSGEQSLARTLYPHLREDWLSAAIQPPFPRRVIPGAGNGRRGPVGAQEQGDGGHELPGVAQQQVLAVLEQPLGGLGPEAPGTRTG